MVNGQDPGLFNAKLQDAFWKTKIHQELAQTVEAIHWVAEGNEEQAVEEDEDREEWEI